LPPLSSRPSRCGRKNTFTAASASAVACSPRVSPSVISSSCPWRLRPPCSLRDCLGFVAISGEPEAYFNFVCKFMLGMGLGFEMPVVLLVLVKLGIVTYSMLASGRRYMIVICFVLGAVLTTPEVITQVLMAIPLYVLYEITVWIAWYWERRDRQQ